MWSERGLFDQQFNKQILQLTGSLTVLSHTFSDNLDKHSDHKVGIMEADGAAGNKDFSVSCQSSFFLKHFDFPDYSSFPFINCVLS